MSATQIIVGWMLVSIVFGLFLHALRVSWRLSVHLDRLDKIELADLRDHDGRICKLESKFIEMRREFQERFSGFDGHISNHETRLCAQFERIEVVDAFRDLANKRIEMNSERSESLAKDVMDMGNILALRRTQEAAPAADPLLEWRQNVGERLGEHAVLLHGIIGRIDVMQQRLESWPPELRSEIAEAYRRMADAVEQLDTAEFRPN